jgi:hypothetical protein
MSTYGYTTALGYQSPYLASRPMPTPPRTYSYLPHNPTPDEVEAYNHYMHELATYQDGMNTRHRSRTRDSSRSTRSKSKSSKSLRRNDRELESRQFLDVQATTSVPVYHRRSASRGHTLSHSPSRSRDAPSLTHSACSDDESEERPASGPTTPYSANVALWRDDVHDSSELPPPPVIPAYLKAECDYAAYMKRHYEPAGSASSTDYSSLVVPALPTPTPSDLPSPAELERVRNQIVEIDYELNSRVLAFTFPTCLDLAHPFPNGEASPLPYTTRNKGLIEHRDYLEKTLFRLDNIQSHCDPQVKNARKQVVTKIHDQLEQLQRMEKMVRHNVSVQLFDRIKPRLTRICCYFRCITSVGRRRHAYMSLPRRCRTRVGHTNVRQQLTNKLLRDTIFV